MPEFLTFTLYAPLAAFGAPAVGERRGSFDRPARSAILGLVGACLGLDRDDEAAHQALAAQYRLAVAGLAAGTLLADYHTAQMPSARRGQRFATRRQELEADDINTVLSRRDYRCDAWHIAALSAAEDARWPLAALQGAMAKPRFVPYLGRKSCPLGLPLGPRIAEADTVIDALRARRADEMEQRLRGDLGVALADMPLVAIDRDVADALGARPIRVDQRRDTPISRARWQFALRAEALVKLA